jgi:hypothetical protein
MRLFFVVLPDPFLFDLTDLPDVREELGVDDLLPLIGPLGC